MLRLNIYNDSFQFQMKYKIKAVAVRVPQTTQNLVFHVVVVQRMTEKRTKIYNARANLLFSSLNLLFGDSSQPPPFSIPSKLLTLHGEEKPYCFTVSCVPKSMFNYL